MLKLEILNILRDPNLTMDQQADMLANMVVRRCGDMSRYIKGNARRAIMREREESARAVADAFERGFDEGSLAQAQETIAKEREEYQDRIDRAYDDGLKNGYHMGLNDGEALALETDDDIAF